MILHHLDEEGARRCSKSRSMVGNFTQQQTCMKQAYAFATRTYIMQQHVAYRTHEESW